MFVGHTCSLTPMIPFVFHIWQSHLFSANVYESFTVFMNISHFEVIFTPNVMKLCYINLMQCNSATQFHYGNVT